MIVDSQRPAMHAKPDRMGPAGLSKDINYRLLSSKLQILRSGRLHFKHTETELKAMSGQTDHRMADGTFKHVGLEYGLIVPMSVFPYLV